MSVWLLGSAVALVLAFAISNGVNDSAAIVAPALASGALTPRVAVVFSALLHLPGPLLGGALVGDTIGSIARAEGSAALSVAVAGVGAALALNVVARRLGMPTSSGQALVGGLVGAALVSPAGPDAIRWGFAELGTGRIVGVAGAAAALLLSPLVGFAAAWALLRAVTRLLRGATLGANRFLRAGQIAASGLLALAHGGNDSYKAAGALTFVLAAGGASASAPFVVSGCAAALALGTLFGGWRIMRTLARGIYRIEPRHGFASQAASAGIVLLASAVGGPVSTSQVVATSIMGVGSAERIRRVRWRVARGILLSFLLTMPVSAAVAAGLGLVLTALTGGVLS